MFSIYLQYQKKTFFHNSFIILGIFSKNEIFINRQRRCSMSWRFDKSKVEDTFKGVDSDINREELRRMADEEGIQIDWSYWDEILQNQSIFEEEEEETGSTSREPNKNKETQPKYVYTTDGKFIKSFNTTRECAEYFEIAPETVCQYARDEKPYFKLGIIITNKPKKVKSNKSKYSTLYSKNLEYQRLLQWKEQAFNDV